MYVFLLLLSVISTAVGLFAVGFGLMPYELSLGNALVVAGAIAIIGGMVLFGLAAAVRQLHRITDALGSRAAPARRPAAGEGAAAAARQAPGSRTGYPPRPDPRDARVDPGAAEPRAAAAPAELPQGEPPERARPNLFGAARGGEPPIVEEHEAVPLAPSRGPAAAVSRGALPRAEPAGEPRPTPADIMARLSNLAVVPPRLAARPEPQWAPSLERPAPEQRSRQNPNTFDAVWPADGRTARPSQPEAIARAPRAEARPDPRPEPRIDVVPESRQEPRMEPPVARDRVERPVGGAPRERIEPSLPPPAAEPRMIAILKSGVIDGMAYTLYTDGSIEAELPQGTMRFASIDELRAHLENAERDTG